MDKKYSIAAKIAYDLTLEYIHQNNVLICDEDYKITSKIKKIENIYSYFYVDLVDSKITDTLNGSVHENINNIVE